MQINGLTQRLQQIYGSAIDEQMARYQATLDQFRQRYGDGPVTIFRAPGRINLIGEHTDYNHGYVMPATLDRDVLLLVRPRPDRQIRLRNVEAQFPDSAFAVCAEIAAAPAGHWSNYARGAAQTIARAITQTEDTALIGFDGLVSGAVPFGVPRGAGLSSSSALTVVVAVALAHLAGWRWEGSQMARLCSDAEWYVGTRGGIMDHFAALLGERDHALFLDCRPDPNGGYHTEAIPLPGSYRLMVVDSGVHHANVRNEFNRRVAACRAGAALLREQYDHVTHLRDVEAIDWSELAALLPEVITEQALSEAGADLGDLPNVPPEAPLRVRACCRHVWTENHRVLAAVSAMRNGRIAEVGTLLNEAHASARDDYQISTPELEVLVTAARQVDGCVGARLTGAGWGGCIVALVHEDVVGEFQRHVTAQYQRQIGRSPALFACRPSLGAGCVGTITA